MYFVIVTGSFNPILKRLRHEDVKFKASLDFLEVHNKLFFFNRELFTNRNVLISSVFQCLLLMLVLQYTFNRMEIPSEQEYDMLFTNAYLVY